MSRWGRVDGVSIEVDIEATGITSHGAVLSVIVATGVYTYHVIDVEVVLVARPVEGATAPSGIIGLRGGVLALFVERVAEDA